MYGKGIYFSNQLGISLDEEYSSKSNDDINYVFFCKITGDKIVKGGQKVGEIGVDSLKDPKIFVIPSIEQSQPLYVVGFYKTN